MNPLNGGIQVQSIYTKIYLHSMCEINGFNNFDNTIQYCTSRVVNI